MADALYILIVIGFFALMVLLVKACDHIIGPDDLPLDRGDDRADDASGVVDDGQVAVR